jgi:hypothetical protein
MCNLLKITNLYIEYLILIYIISIIYTTFLYTILKVFINQHLPNIVVFLKYIY